MDDVDTSALLKGYVSESDRGAFVAWVAQLETCCISSLSAVELHCAIQRRPIASRTLDTLHLAVALHYRCSGFATADRVQAEAARRLGFKVTTFFTPA